HLGRLRAPGRAVAGAGLCAKGAGRGGRRLRDRDHRPAPRSDTARRARVRSAGFAHAQLTRSCMNKSALPLPSLAARWYVLVMTVIVSTLSIADRYVISTVLEPIRLELRLTDSNIAFLTGVSLAIFYVLFGLPLSWLVDRYSRRWIITASVIAWSFMTT